MYNEILEIYVPRKLPCIQYTLVSSLNMHCISSLKLVGSMAVGLGLSGVGLVDMSVEINLGEFIYIQNVFLKVGDLQSVASYCAL